MGTWLRKAYSCGPGERMVAVLQAVSFDLYETLITEFDPDWTPSPSTADQLRSTPRCSSGRRVAAQFSRLEPLHLHARLEQLVERAPRGDAPILQHEDLIGPLQHGTAM
jgi:hypothetical protein